MNTLEVIAPQFVEIAHRIVWATAATVDEAGLPATRILHPVWEWDGINLHGWIATSPHSPKARDLERTPCLSITYWDSGHETCTARCRTAWLVSSDERRALWERFANAAPPLGYDPSIVPAWQLPDAPAFGALALTPDVLRCSPAAC